LVCAHANLRPSQADCHREIQGNTPSRLRPSRTLPPSPEGGGDGVRREGLSDRCRGWPKAAWSSLPLGCESSLLFSRSSRSLARQRYHTPPFPLRLQGLLTLFAKSFASFNHSTCALSVPCPYVALRGIHHALQTAVPSRSTPGCLANGLSQCACVVWCGIGEDPPFSLTHTLSLSLSLLRVASSCCAGYRRGSSPVYGVYAYGTVSLSGGPFQAASFRVGALCSSSPLPPLSSL